MHSGKKTVKVDKEIKLYFLIKDMMASNTSTATIYPVIMLRCTYGYRFWSCE